MMKMDQPMKNVHIWIREFQLEYLKRGIKDRKAQECYLLKLAEQYKEKFNNSGDWKDALKVNILVHVPHMLATYSPCWTFDSYLYTTGQLTTE